MKTLSRLLPAVVVAMIFAALAFAQVVPGQGITRAIAPLKRVGSAVEVDTNGALKVATVRATVGTFGSLIVGSCTGCSSGGGGGGGGGGGTTTIDLSTIGTLTAWWDASKNVFSDTGCTTTVTTGGTIACWTDRVNGLAAKEVAANKDPIYAWQDRFGHPGVRMNQDPNTQNNGARLTTASTGAPIPAAYTACAIFRMAAPYGNFPAGNTFQIFEEADGTPRGLGMLVGLAEPQIGTQFRTNINASGTGSIVTTPVNYALTNSVVEECSLVNSTKMQTIVDGMASPTTVTGASVQDGNVVFVIGNGDYSAVANPYTLYELFQYNTVVTGTGLTAIFTYGRQKYGVDDTFGSGSSSSGGGTVSDPLTVNGWTPASGTATITGAQSVTGASSTGASTVNGNSHITGNLTVDGSISGVTNISAYATFVMTTTTPSGTTADGSRITLETEGATPIRCDYMPDGNGSSNVNPCRVSLLDSATATTLCTTTFACNVGRVNQTFSCSGSGATTDVLKMQTTAPTLHIAPSGVMSCSLREAP